MKLINSVKNLIFDKVYLAIVTITALAGYGYELTHCSYGVDDVIYDWYIDSGRLVSMGRFTPWLINKFFKINEFTPFIVDFIGVILIILAGTVLCVVFAEILGEDRVPSWIYAVFTSLMLVYPMNGEVFIYYMHNGMGVAFLLSAIAIYLMYSVKGEGLKAQLPRDILALVLMVLAICCYESFSIVIITIGVILVLLKAFSGEKIQVKTDGIWVVTVVLVTAVAMVLRSIITKILCVIMGLDVYQTSGGMIGWQFSDNAGEIGTVLKNQLMSNFLFYGAGYFPITLFLFAVVALIVLCGIVSWKNRDFWPIVLGILLVIGQFSISFLLGVMQLYRMSQSIVVLVAFSVFILLVLISKWKIGRVVAVILAGIILYGSAREISQLFVFEYNMCDRCADKVKEIGSYLQSNYDLSEKKVVFVGEFSRSMDEQDYLHIRKGEAGYRFLNWCDVHVYGYDPAVVEAGRFYKKETVTDGDVLTWSVNAYNTHNWATQKLFAHYGYDIKITDTNEEYDRVVDYYNNDCTDTQDDFIEYDDYVIVVLR